MAAPLADLRARMAREPARWRWQRPHGDAASREPQPITDALQAWLAALDQRSASQWRVAAGGAVEGAGHSSSRSNTAQLRLTRDGVLQATIGFDRSGVWVDGNAGAAHAAMSPPAIDALRSSLREALRLATP